MPRVGGDGSGGPEKPGGSSFGGWLGGAARAMTGGGAGGGYVVLGGTRYGLRLSQESLPPAASREESQERRRKRSSRESDSRERLTEKSNTSGHQQQTMVELSNSVSDCCCIGPRSRLPLPRSGAAVGVVGGSYGGVIAGGHCPERAACTDLAQPSANSNNNRGMLQAVGLTGHQSHQQSPQSAPSTSSAASSPPSFSSSSSSSSVSSGASTTCCTLGSSQSVAAASALQSVSVPRQLAQWTKHQTLKLQEPAVIAVDRLHRFRWSGGGGGSGKKSSSGPRSEKAERLRELTEKLKGPAPVPPPRRPSRVQASSPPPPNYHQPPQNQSATPSTLSCIRCDGRPTCRSYTYSEGSGHPTTNQQAAAHTRNIGRSESVGEECLTDATLTNDLQRKISDPRRVSRTSRIQSSQTQQEQPQEGERNSGGDVSEHSVESSPLHLRQYSDSVVDSGTCTDDLCLNPSSSGTEAEARDAITRLEPRGSLLSFHRAGVPFRSASFGQVDFNQGNRQKIQPVASSNRTENKDVRASTLPRRRGDVSPSVSTPQNSPNRQSPRTSTPSVDSAVGSAEGLGGPQSSNLEEIRPRSDGSDSLATSSALTSPEPPVPENNETRVDLTQPEVPSIGMVAAESLFQILDGNTVEEAVQKENRIEPHEVIITPPSDEPRLSQASEGSEAPSETPSEASSPSGKSRRYRGDTSKRRKGVYITQWPEPLDSERNKLSAQSSEERDEPPATPSDLSDCEGHAPRRYNKRPLRGPYGQMLEAEMAKPRAVDLSLDEGLRTRRKVSANLSYNASGNNSGSEPPTPCHHRTTSSPSKLEGLPGPSPELLAELLRGSSERVARAPVHRNDTRTHVVVELYDTERSYVEALQILVNKYLQPLKSPENAGLVDAATVDEIFYQIPAILNHHEVFLEELRRRLDTWEIRQTIGDVFLDVFTKPVVLETYTLFLDNWKSARKAIKTTCHGKPAFARFLETMEREHKGKLGLDQLLIKPVQKIPRYELLIQRLLKHTDSTHPDYELLQAAQKEVHELVVKINCTERESLEWEQQQTTLRELQALVEGLAGIVTNDRAFVRHDLVTIASNQGTRKERALFLFSDLLVITSIKRRSGTIRKPSTSCPNSLVGLLEANKYKMLMRIPLDDLEVMKAKDENLRRMAREVDHLREDCKILNELQELASTLHGPKQQLEELIKDMLGQTQRQLTDRNSALSQLACLELTLNTQTGIENISVMFTKPDKRASWEESFNEAKQKLADRRPSPEFVGPLRIPKTRAGLQFTCAAPTLVNGQGSPDVWVCNSDGFVGQVCVLSLSPESPQVTSCNGVCNARILCVAGIPGYSPGLNSCVDKNSSLANSKNSISISVQDVDASGGNIHLDSSSSSEESDADDIPCADSGSASLPGDMPNIEDTNIEPDRHQPTMWLGTEDGCVHVYNCNDNIRVKKHRVKLLLRKSVHCIIYMDNKVFVSLDDGKIFVYPRNMSKFYICHGWDIPDPTSINVGSEESPVLKMLPMSGKLWCGCRNSIKILNTQSLEIEHTFAVSSDASQWVSCMASSGGLGVWISLQYSAVLRLFHSGSYECLTDIHIGPAVTKMLANCDDIIRQHKASCLRVTALLACNDLLWIGTSAGVLLTVPIPHIKPSTQRMSQPPIVSGIPYGHTGHVRFLTCVESSTPPKPDPRPKVNRYSLKSSKVQQNNINCGKLLVISGGDGYEDFKEPQASAGLQAGREDSTNHLLLWKV